MEFPHHLVSVKNVSFGKLFALTRKLSVNNRGWKIGSRFDNVRGSINETKACGTCLITKCPSIHFRTDYVCHLSKQKLPEAFPRLVCGDTDYVFTSLCPVHTILYTPKLQSGRGKEREKGLVTNNELKLNDFPRQNCSFKDCKLSWLCMRGLVRGRASLSIY